MKNNWNKLKDKSPEKVGNYLCVTNDNLIMVCFVAANGWWSKIPDAKFYGDLGKCFVNGKDVDREVVYWRDCIEELLKDLPV